MKVGTKKIGNDKDGEGKALLGLVFLPFSNKHFTVKTGQL